MISQIAMTYFSSFLRSQFVTSKLDLDARDKESSTIADEHPEK